MSSRDFFQGRYPDVLKGYGEEEGWSGKPFTAWLRARLADSLTEQDLDCFAWKDDAYLVHFAVSKMIVELHGLFAELLQEDKGMNDAQSLGRNDSHLWRPLVADFER